MRDSDFLTLDAGDARNHALGQSTAERDRLLGLYLERHQINLAEVDPRAGHSAPGTVATGGWWLVALGVLGALGAFVFPVGVDVGGLYGGESIANLDRIAIRHMLFNAAMAFVVSGFVLVAVGALQAELRRR